VGLMTLDEAKSLMSDESLNKLKEVVSTKPVINMENKVNNDILMQALCRAVSEDVVHFTTLDDRLIKLLNSPTNTLSQNKLFDILKHIRLYQPNIVCFISLMVADMSSTLKTWILDGSDNVKFIDIFEYVINEFEITPSMVRNKMIVSLKPTIVNNVSQFVSKYLNTESEEERRNITVSINTISRLVNMMDHLLFAEFRKI